MGIAKANRRRKAPVRKRTKRVLTGKRKRTPAEPIPVDIDWFRARLKDRNITQRSLAAALKKDAAVLTRILQGKREFEASDVAVIAELLQENTDEVLRRLGAPVVARGVRIAGKITPDGRVSTVSARKGALMHSIDMPANAEALIAETEGGPLGAYNGAAFIYTPTSTDDPAPHECFGRLCIIEADNHLTPLLGTLAKASERGKVTLEVFGSEEKISVSKVHRASAVVAIFLA